MRNSRYEWIQRVFYPRHDKDLWPNLLESAVKDDSIILEIGSGSGQGKQNKSYPRAQLIAGVDPDPRIQNNPFLDEAHTADFADFHEPEYIERFDLIYSRMTLEHVSNASDFVKNISKYLAPGGKSIHLTTSKYYVTSLINDYVPFKMKAWLIKNLGSGNDAENIFDAYYRLNDKKTLDSYASEYGLTVTCSFVEAPPGYVRRSFLLMLIYVICFKPINAFCPSSRPTLTVVFEKTPRIGR